MAYATSKHTCAQRRDRSSDDLRPQRFLPSNAHPLHITPYSYVNFTEIVLCVARLVTFSTRLHFNITFRSIHRLRFRCRADRGRLRTLNQSSAVDDIVIIIRASAKAQSTVLHFACERTRACMSCNAQTAKAPYHHVCKIRDEATICNASQASAGQHHAGTAVMALRTELFPTSLAATCFALHRPAAKSDICAVEHACCHNPLYWVMKYCEIDA